MIKGIYASPSKRVPGKAENPRISPIELILDFSDPTANTCRIVNSTLAMQYGNRIRLVKMNNVGLGVNGSEVPSVFDALIRTILWQKTNNKTSSLAKRSLDERFREGNYCSRADGVVGISVPV